MNLNLYVCLFSQPEKFKWNMQYNSFLIMLGYVHAHFCAFTFDRFMWSAYLFAMTANTFIRNYLLFTLTFCSRKKENLNECRYNLHIVQILDTEVLLVWCRSHFFFLFFSFLLIFKISYTHIFATFLFWSKTREILKAIPY